MATPNEAVDRPASHQAIIQVLYPAGAKFDRDYYFKTHMPLVQKLWQPLGLRSWNIVKLPADTNWSWQAILHFDSFEAFEKARVAHGAEIFGDIPNFSNEMPKSWVGSFEGSSSEFISPAK